ncbi:DUF551 domain-containing protein [Cronobacter malonaticus]|uniref:DUF551 domain-containing protein n=1 Tax=Cronobacter malonaticus TaxID=413503 RepID=UPI0028956D49|nr:DUF551 domain-containing protein [Cronobacter malonaticus]MDT3535638.1 DUF551 domain-containing protein [Cronobacter malonaticus]
MSTISNERLEEIAEEDNGSDVLFESSVLARELLALRKERERAEPVAWLVCGSKTFKDRTASTREVAEQAVKDRKDGSSIKPLYTAPFAPSHENVHYADAAEEEIAALRKRIAELETAQTATVVHDAATAIRACLDEFPESVHDIVEECADIAENASRAAMIRSAMQPCDKCGLTGIHACMGSVETDTASQQFESLAGKVVGRSDGFECTPVADLYELLTKCGECYDYTTSAKVAADWIKEGYSAREYVKLDRLQEAMTQGSAGEGDGWIPCSERMPVEKDIVLVVDDGYFVCEAQYREGDFFSAVRGNNEFFETTCRDVEFWQPLPEPPCK